MNLPAALQPLTKQPRWVIWFWTMRRDGRGEIQWTKAPRQTSGRNASSKSSGTWATYADALAAKRRLAADGLGYMLLKDPLKLGVHDLDDCRNPETGEIASWAEHHVIQAEELGVYVEVTPSGTGLRLIGTTSNPPLHRRFAVPNAAAKAGIEIYRNTNTGRYVTVTGWTLNGGSISGNLDPLTDSVLAEYDGPPVIDAPSIAPGLDRSAHLHSEVWKLASQGRGIGEIAQALRQHPAADKYGHRLTDEILRSYDKWRQQKGTSASPIALESATASTYKMRGIRWFWPNRFALGAIGLLGGLPDKGKGQITYYMVAAATKEIEWPCGEGVAPQGNVVILTAEDNIETTVLPRLVAAGADPDKVHIIGMAKNPDGTGRMFNLATDLPLLRKKLQEVGNVVLVIIDPVSAYLGVGKINNSSTTDVRGVLGPLSKLAEEKQIAIVCVMHFNKKADVTNAMLRIADSLAYVAASRHTYFVTEDPENEDFRLFMKAKNNLSPDKRGLRYGFAAKKVGHDEDLDVDIWAPYVVWDKEHVKITAIEAMEAESGGKSSRAAGKEAEEFLGTRLALGPIDSTELEEEAKANGIARATLFRAKRRMGIKAQKAEGTMKGGWAWTLAPAPKSIKERE